MPGARPDGTIDGTAPDETIDEMASDVIDETTPDDTAPDETVPDETVPEDAREAFGDFHAVGPDPIDLMDLCARVAGPGYGAVATFSGTVRDTFEGRPVRHLEYEAFEPMCLEILRSMTARLRARFDVGRVAIVHRTGRLEVGETSVAIAVSAPHRRAALEACSEAIEGVKRDLPVWKKEVFESGEVWRENEVPSAVSQDGPGERG